MFQWRVLMLILAMAAGVPTSASALTFDSNLFYLSDSLKVDSNSATTHMFFDLAVTLNLTKKGQVVLGWNYGSISITQSGDTSTTFSLTEMGPKLGYYFDKEFQWSAFFTYNLQSTATYDGSGSNAEWRGTSMKFDVGYATPLTQAFYMGIRLNYYSASFGEQLVSESDYSTISNTRGIIYPSVSLLYRLN